MYSSGKPTDGNYPLLSEAIKNGLFHPRCKDSTSTYYEGITTLKPVTSDEMAEMDRREKLEQQHSYYQNQAIKNQRIADYSLDDENYRIYQHRANQSQKKADEIRKKLDETVANSSESGIMKSGARIIDLFSDEANEFAEMYYEEIRHFSTDFKKIANNLGKSEVDIRRIKAYLFENKSYYNPTSKKWERFTPDCAIAHSWQRLMIGNDIKPHDRTLIEHELFEMELKKNNPNLSHLEAHTIASKKYNYQKEADEYYDSLKKH